MGRSACSESFFTARTVLLPTLAIFCGGACSPEDMYEKGKEKREEVRTSSREKGAERLRKKRRRKVGAVGVTAQITGVCAVGST